MTTILNNSPTNIILTLLLAAALITDLRQGKIYNMVVFPALAAGILLRLASRGVEALPSLGCSLLLPLLLLPFWLFGRGIGAGDIKLLAAVSALLEPAVFLSCLIFSFLLAGVMGVLLLAATKRKDSTLPMALPIAAGTMAILMHPVI